MRLLKKEELSVAKANDKAKEIAEGLKISRRVDALRELHANEEAMLEKFRIETLTSTQKEIDESIVKRDELIAQVKELEEKLSRLSPKMASTRSELLALKNELADKAKEIQKKSKEIDLKEIDIALILKNSLESEQRAVTHENLTEEIHKKAKEIEEYALNVLKRAEIIEVNALKSKAEAEKAISLRDNDLVSKEKEVLDREELVSYKEKELRMKEVRLIDREKTLERELERIRQNRL